MHEILKQHTRTKLQYHYMNDAGKVRLKESSKLEFYREVKTDYEFEKYLSWVKDRRHKSAFIKLRISAHKLYIETGRNLTKSEKPISIHQEKRELVHHAPIKYKIFEGSKNLNLKCK